MIQNACFQKETLGWFKKNQWSKPWLFACTFAVFWGDEIRPSYMARDYNKPLSMLMLLLSSFIWPLVWFQLQGFRSWQMLAWWVALRSLQKMLLPVTVYAMRRTKNDLKTGTKMTWKLILGVENKKCRVDFLAVNLFWKLWELPWVGKQLRLQWRCGHHLASMLMFGGRTRQPPKLTKQNTRGKPFAGFQTGLYIFQRGFFGGEKFVQPKFEDPKCWNLKNLAKTKTKKQPPHLAVFIKRSA